MKKLIVLLAMFAGLFFAPTNTHANEMYRVYNPNSGEHFYTGDLNEVHDLVAGNNWIFEGTGWIAPNHSNFPVYRLYNENAGDHHYTMSRYEKDSLVNAGWKDEGIGWYSADISKYPVHRQYNPNAKVGTHNFTVNLNEHKSLVANGWRAEGTGWYAQSPNLKPTLTFLNLEGKEINSYKVKVGDYFHFFGTFTGADYPYYNAVDRGLGDATFSDNTVVCWATDVYDYSKTPLMFYVLTNPTIFQTKNLYANKVGTCIVTLKAPNGAKNQISVIVTDK